VDVAPVGVLVAPDVAVEPVEVPVVPVSGVVVVLLVAAGVVEVPVVLLGVVALFVGDLEAVDLALALAVLAGVAVGVDPRLAPVTGGGTKLPDCVVLDAVGLLEL